MEEQKFKYLMSLECCHCFQSMQTQLSFFSPLLISSRAQLFCSIQPKPKKKMCISHRIVCLDFSV